jgi:hypothetical protein
LSFIAQELQAIHPNLVSKSKYQGAEILNVNYIEIVPLLISQIQSLQNQIDELKNQLIPNHLQKEPDAPESREEPELKFE